MRIWSIVVSLIIIYFLYAAYDYGTQLSSCNCAESVKSNITNIKYTEIFLIVMQVVGILINIFNYKMSLQYFPLFIIYLIAIFIILVVFIYNIIVFVSKTDSCYCTNTWQKHILYVQAVVYSISSLVIMLGVIVLIRIKSNIDASPALQKKLNKLLKKKN